MVHTNESVQALINEGLGVQLDIVRLAAAVAAGAPPDGPEDRDLRRAFMRRDEVASRIGLATLAWAARAADRAAAGVESPPTLEPTEIDSVAALPESALCAPPPTALEAPAPALVAEPAPPVPIVPGPPATGADLQTLVQNGMGPRWKKAKVKHDVAALEIESALKRIGPPVRVVTTQVMEDEVARVAKEAGHLLDWTKRLPKEKQQQLIGLLSSKARYLQDESGLLEGAAASKLDRAFKLMTAWSKADEPGWVPGLKRDGGPIRETWWDEMTSEWQGLGGPAPIDDEGAGASLDDLRATLERGDSKDVVLAKLRALHVAGVHWSDPRLVRLLTPHHSLLAGAKDLKTLRAQVKRALEEEESTEAKADFGDQFLPVPPEWPYYALTTRRRACVVGGDARVEAQERIQGCFRLQAVTWERREPRKVQALAERIRGRKVDLVLILREFVAHGVSEAVIDACRDADVPFALVDKGYGVVQCRLALERYLQPRLAVSS